MENFDMIGQPIGTIIWVTIGADARGDDVEFVGGCEYVFTITRNASSVEQTLLEVISPVDVAVSSLTAPRTGENLTTGETVSISITNEGTETLRTLEVGYKVNGGDAVEEILNHALAPQETYEYSLRPKWTCRPVACTVFKPGPKRKATARWVTTRFIRQFTALRR